jgi:hypothetical protein
MDCSICQEKYKCVLEISTCGHFFCSDCLYQWYGKKQTCALCRNDFSLYDVGIKFFRDGIRTRQDSRLIDEEKIILILAREKGVLKEYHLYGKFNRCYILIERILDKCLENVYLFKDSTNPHIHKAVRYIKNCDPLFKFYIGINQDKYKKLLKEIGIPNENENVIISNQGSITI